MINNLNNVKMSFWQLIKSISKIEIPIIQRDYVQGRNDEKTKKIRNRFLESLLKAIVENQKTLELDFIYGNICKDGSFQPLDGQQRLTTLFLLHWFIARMENKLEEAKGELLKFNYETRITSREFCKALVKYGDCIGLGNTISKQIKDSSWFFISWKKDPTIKAMLIMLDAIESKINQIDELDKHNLWEKLISKTNCPITFHCKELNGFGLSDDLYIKMNARGKALTDFEHFKAQFEKYVAINKWEVQMQKNPEKTFSHKIDTIWTDLFWKHRGSDNQVDNKFVKFIAGIAINYYAQNQDIFPSEEKDLLIRKGFEKKNKLVSIETIKRERVEQRIAELSKNPSNVNPIDFFQEDAFIYLKNCLNVYGVSNYDDLIPESLDLWDYCIDSSLFKELVNEGERETTYKQRVLFYAQTEYLINKNEFNKESSSDWMRVVRNIIQNSKIDSASAFIGAIGLINELSIGCNDIYVHLSKEIVKSGFASTQIEEEILKSKIISVTWKNKEVLFATEDTNFCKGKIKFALYCIDCDSEINFDAGKLENIQTVIKKHLDSINISNDFRRGLMTIDDNNFYNYWSSWLYAVNARKRCLIEDTKDLFNFSYNQNYRNYLKILLNDLTTKDLIYVINSYSIPDSMPNWKKRIIEEEDLLKFTNKNYIAIAEDDSCCWLIPENKVANSKEGAEKCKMIN